MRAGPLAGYRVLEFGANLTAPLAAMLLGDQGAEVIKVEPPSGDQVRYAGSKRTGVEGMGTIFLGANRNKRSIVLDLKDSGDREVALRLAASCDVVIQNFRPGVMERIGLGYDDLRRLRKDIIYLSIDGLGRAGPDAGRRVYDIVVQGIAGYVGTQIDPTTGEPHIIRNAIVDKVTAFAAWQAATAALLHRERTGQGQQVHVSMLKVALAFLWPDAAAGATLIGEDVELGVTMASLRFVYPTKDGHLLVGAVSNDEWQSICRAIDRPELGSDSRFATIRSRSENAEAMGTLLAEALAERTTAEWLAALRREDAVFAPINTLESLHSDPQVQASEALTCQHHPLAGELRQPVHPIEFQGMPMTPDDPAPALNEHGAEILRQLGSDRRRPHQEA